MTEYSPVVKRLLSLGDPDFAPTQDGFDYRGMGLTHENIPELIELASDETLPDKGDKVEVWARFHAICALGDLQAIRAAEPLLAILDSLARVDFPDELLIEEIGRCLVKIGADILPLLRTFLLDRSKNEYGRMVVSESLSNIGKADPGTRDECIAILTQQLEGGADDDPGLNGSVVSSLIDLKAASAFPAIKAVYERGDVDVTICGSVEYVEFELGLRDRPPKNVFGDAGTMWDPSKAEKERSRAQERQKKQKRKQAKVSRRRNRR